MLINCHIHFTICTYTKSSHCRLKKSCFTTCIGIYMFQWAFTCLGMTSWNRKGRYSSWDCPESTNTEKETRDTNTGLLSTKTLRYKTQRFNIKRELENKGLYFIPQNRESRSQKVEDSRNEVEGRAWCCKATRFCHIKFCPSPSLWSCVDFESILPVTN